MFQLNHTQKLKLKDKFKLSLRHQQKGKSKDYHKALFKYTFISKKHKFIVDVEKYDLEFYLISFYPKLNLDFEIKQARLRKMGRPYHTKYSYLTNEHQAIQTLNLLIFMMEEFLNNNPLASFGYYGAPDINTNSEHNDMFNTKRFRIYNEMIKRNFNNTFTIMANIRFSGGLVLNNKILDKTPELKSYGEKVLKSHT